MRQENTDPRFASVSTESGKGTPSKKTQERREFSHFVKKQLPGLYSSAERLPYHGWQHIEELLRRADRMLEHCVAQGVHVDQLVLEHAILFHDVLFDLDHEALGHESKEELSAFYARNMLLKFGFREAHVREVESAILATHPSLTPETVEQVLMRAIDVQGLMAPYEKFRADTEKLRREAEILRGKPVSTEEHILGSLHHLAEYFCPFLELTSSARSERGASLWHERAARNVLQVYQEAKGRDDVVTVTLLHPHDRLEGLLTNQTGLVFDLAMGEKTRRARLNEHSAVSSADQTLIPLPLENGIIPLPDRSVSLILADSSQVVTLYEALRVLKEGGRITFRRLERFGGNLVDLVAGLIPGMNVELHEGQSELTLCRVCD